MFSREKSAEIKRNFWIAFGKKLKSKRSFEDERVNWINYKTSVRHLFFKMDVTKKKASIAIEIGHKDLGLQELFYEQFLELKTYFNSIMEEEWVWEQGMYEEGRTVSKIYLELYGVNIFNFDDWEQISDFLYPRIIKLDEFWTDAKESFIALQS